MNRISFLLIIFNASIFSYNSTFSPASIKPSTTKNIYSLEQVNLGGVRQTILITGKDSSKPLLLFVHGGPGFTEIALVRKYNRELDKYFIVVNWDQRGTNLSYDPAIPTATMSMDQIVSDAHELVTILKKRFSRKKIFLVGHSWGSAVGAMLADKYPQDFYAYIGVGQVANMLDNERVSTQFAMQSAKLDHNKKAIEELKSILPYPSTRSTLKQLYISRKWMTYYGGEVNRQHNAKSIFSGIANGKNPLYDTTKTDEGTNFSMATLWSPFLKTDLPASVPELKIPVYFLLGKHDFNVPYTLAENYLRVLKAPSKTLILFKNSAHLIPFEEPEKFNRVLKEIGEKTLRGNS